MPDNKVTRRALLTGATGAAAVLAATACADDKPMQTPPPAAPSADDAEATRLLALAEAQVVGGLTDDERKRVREQARGYSAFVAPLRRVALTEGTEPFAPLARGTGREP
jgi:hypothetical protein